MFPATSSRPRLWASALLMALGTMMVCLGSGMVAGSALRDGDQVTAAAMLAFALAVLAGASLAIPRILARLRELAPAPEAAS